MPAGGAEEISDCSIDGIVLQIYRCIAKDENHAAGFTKWKRNEK